MIFAICFSGGKGIVSVSISPSMGAFLSRSTELADQQAVRGGQENLPAPCWCMTSAAPQIEPAVLIMSSKIKRHPALDLAADHVGLLGLLGRAAAFVDDGQWPPRRDSGPRPA